MNEKDIFAQVIGREVNNALGRFNPAFRVFAPTVTNYIMNAINIYLDAFMSPETGKLNTKAGEAYVKEELNKKIEDFVKKFEEQSKKNGEM